MSRGADCSRSSRRILLHCRRRVHGSGRPPRVPAGGEIRSGRGTAAHRADVQAAERMTRDELAARTAAEIDRLVVRGHEVAADHPDPPPVLAGLTAHPALLNTVAIVLLAQPITRADVTRTVPYTPARLITALIDNNVGEGVVVED